MTDEGMEWPTAFGLTLKQGTLVIESVEEGSPAARLNIRPGSRVVGINDMKDDMHLTSNEDYATNLKFAMSEAEQRREATLLLRVVECDVSKLVPPGSRVRVRL